MPTDNKTVRLTRRIRTAKENLDIMLICHLFGKISYAEIGEEYVFYMEAKEALRQHSLSRKRVVELDAPDIHPN